MRIRQTFYIIAAFAACLTSCKKEPLVSDYKEETEQERLQNAAEIFGGSNSEKVKGYKELDEFFTDLGKETRSDSNFPVEKYFSSEAMYQSLESSGVLKSMSSTNKKAFKKQFIQKIISMGSDMEPAEFDKFKILKVNPLNSNELEVYVRHYDNEFNISTPMRWWLVGTEDGWRAYDNEDIEMGIRTISLMVTLVKSAIGDRPEPWLPHFLKVTNQLNSLEFENVEDFTSIKKPLIEMRKHILPNDIKRFASMMYNSALQAEEKFEESLVELESSHKGGYDGPMWHYQMGSTLMGLEKYEEALSELTTHTETFGKDSDVQELIADCYLLIGKINESREAALEGLKDNPYSLNCMASLAVASDLDQIKKDWLPKVSSFLDHEQVYEISIDYAISLEYTEQSEFLISLLKENLPNSELIEYYEEDPVEQE